MGTNDERLTPDGIVPAPAEGDEPVGDPFAGLLGGGGLDFGALMEQASNVQAQMLAAQEQAASTEVEGVAGGGAVRIVVTGAMEPRSVMIDPSAVDPDDVDMLQDLVLAALRDAIERANAIQSESMGLGGLDISGLFGG